jgi:hypothetical protein
MGALWEHSHFENITSDVKFAVDEPLDNQGNTAPCTRPASMTSFIDIT